MVASEIRLLQPLRDRLIHGCRLPTGFNAGNKESLFALYRLDIVDDDPIVTARGATFESILRSSPDAGPIECRNMSSTKAYSSAL